MESLFTCLQRIDSGVIFLVDNKTGQLKPVIAKSRNLKKNAHLSYSRTIVNRVMREGKAVMMADTSSENEDELSESIEVMRIKSIMCVPLISKSRIRGVIYVHSVKAFRGFCRDDLFLFTGLSSPAALAIDNALLYAKSKRSEEARHASEKKYRLLVENAIDAIFIVQEGLIKYANPSTFELTGYGRESLSRLSFTGLFHPEDRDLILERHTRKLKGEPVPNTLSFRLLDRTGEVRHVQTNIIEIEWEGKTAKLYFVRDMTEQKLLEEQLLQLRKMDAISLLAGRISHDINNILMGIQGNTSLMLLDVDEQHPHYKRLKNIEGYIEKGADLTEQIADFARGGKYVVKETDINFLLTKGLEKFSKTGNDLNIHTKLQKGVWPLEIDQKQMEKVFLQLFENSRQAMPGGGGLRIETKNVEMSHDFAEPLGLVSGRYVKISISDSGLGMDEATRNQIFDPFFTTEAMGRGSGLGLAAVYGVVKNHEGMIDVISEKGKGATFMIYLPSREPAEKEDQEKRAAPQETVVGNETILLVDDEEVIAELAKDVLSALGYRAMVAKGGREALEIYRKNRHSIDMVILDMVMPDLDGRQTFDLMRGINPDVKVLIASGYCQRGQASEMLDMGCKDFIQKPFNMKILSKKIREVLSMN
jgi:PAS domain S-box-containing protein